MCVGSNRPQQQFRAAKDELLEVPLTATRRAGSGAEPDFPPWRGPWTLDLGPKFGWLLGRPLPATIRSLSLMSRVLMRGSSMQKKDRMSCLGRHI